MNRRNFFGAIAAVVTAACVPGADVSAPWLAGRWASDADFSGHRHKGPGHMLRYSSGAQTFRYRAKLFDYQRQALHYMTWDYSKVEQRAPSYKLTNRSEDL